MSTVDVCLVYVYSPGKENEKQITSVRKNKQTKSHIILQLFYFHFS